MPYLSADLVPSIADPGASLALVRVKEVRLGPAEAGLELGTVIVRVEEVLKGATPRADDLLEWPFERMADPTLRARNAVNQWNALALEPGALWIVAARPLARPAAWEALAARTLPSADDPTVVEVRRACEIESFGDDPDALGQRLRQALLKGGRLLRRYAVDAIARRTPREAGSQLLGEAITSGACGPEVRLELASRLIDLPFFDRSRGADPANRNVISSVAAGLVGDPDPKRRAQWTRDLAGRLLSRFSDDPAENQRIRAGLVGSVNRPLAERLASALADQAARGPEGDRARANQLLQAWQGAAVGPQ